MQDLSGVSIVRVEQKLTQKGDPRYIVAINTPIRDWQEPSTFDGVAASKAQQFLNQVVDVRLEQRGKYWNFIDVAPPGQLPPVPLAAGTPIQPGLVAGTPIQAPQPPIATPIPFVDHEAEKNERIARQNASTAGFNFVAAVLAGSAVELSLEDAKKLAWEIADEIFEGNQARLGSAAPLTLASAPPATASEVQQQVNTVLGGTVLTTASGLRL